MSQQQNIKTVIVTGAAGYIGGAICIELKNQGYRVIGVDKPKKMVIDNEVRVEGAIETVLPGKKSLKSKIGESSKPAPILLSSLVKNVEPTPPPIVKKTVTNSFDKDPVYTPDSKLNS